MVEDGSDDAATNTFGLAAVTCVVLIAGVELELAGDVELKSVATMLELDATEVEMVRDEENVGSNEENVVRDEPDVVRDEPDVVSEEPEEVVIMAVLVPGGEDDTVDIEKKSERGDYGPHSLETHHN